MNGSLTLRAAVSMLLALLLALPPSMTPVQNDPLLLAGAICHADGWTAPDDHSPPLHDGHVHCALCGAGLAFLSPPPPAPPSSPTSVRLAQPTPASTRAHIPNAPRAYASRAPPSIG